MRGGQWPPEPFHQKDVTLLVELMWYLCILRCGDGSLYTGITTDVEKRLEAHRTGRGAKYTRGRGPLELVYREACGGHSDALRRELAVKKMTREQKIQMIQQET